MTKTFSGALLGGAALLIAAPALAQQTAPTAPSQSMFVRDRNVSVLERPRPGYDPMPIPLGGFTGLPKLDLGVEANDNVYASTTSKRPDAIITVNPEFDLLSRWSRNALQAYVRGAAREYSKYSSESTIDWQAGLAGRLDVGHGYLSAGGDSGDFTEARTSPNTVLQTSKPVRYTQSNAFVSGVEELNRVRLTARYDYNVFSYQNAKTPAGAFFRENDRDRADSTYTGKAEYAVSPATAVFIDASYNEHRYRVNPPTVPASKNSKGDQVDIGANFDLTHVARGEVEVGYLKQDFTAKVGSVSGFSAKGLVEWFPTQLTTVRLTGSRSIQDSAAIGSPAYVSEVVSLGANHELLRNVILSGQVGTEGDNYQGVDRHDRSTNASVGAKYMFNRMVGVNLTYLYQNQKSTGASKAPAYTDNRITASASLAF